MTLNDIVCHKISIPEFYEKYLANRLVTIAEAGKEPLTIGELHAVTAYKSMMTSHDGTMLSLGEAFCLCCIDHLISRFRRRDLPLMKERCIIAAQMVFLYKHWTVLDLPTFVNLCVGGRIPSYKNGQTEYELISLETPAIMGKLEAYDRMRPNPQLLQGSSPAKQVVKPLTNHQLTHLIDGTPYDFKVPYDDFVHGYVTPSGDPRRNAELYWRSRPNFDVDYADQCFDAKASYRQPIVKTVDEVLT